jgi:hypothetical protein
MKNESDLETAQLVKPPTLVTMTSDRYEHWIYLGRDWNDFLTRLSDHKGLPRAVTLALALKELARLSGFDEPLPKS